MPYYTSLVGEMRNILLSTNFFNIDQQFHQENIRKETKIFLLRHIDETLITKDIVSLKVSRGVFQEILVFTVEGMYFRPRFGPPRFLSYCWTEKIERVGKHTLSFFDGYSYLKITSSLINLEQLEATYRKLQRINEQWRQIMIWDNEKNSGYTCGASPFHPVAHLLDTRPCSAARCAGYFPTDEEISQEVKEWIKNNPEKNAELREELDRFNGIQNQKSVTQ